MKSFLKNYLTTLFGIGAGILTYVSGGHSWADVGKAVLLGALGVFAKDANKTGT